MRAIRCWGCGRRFAIGKRRLAITRDYCRRRSVWSALCDDKQCEGIRRIVRTPVKITSFKVTGVPHHCTENLIKFIEKGHF
jgi:hypothetical protein